ncbi:hypothetical protein ABFS82_07G081300 [Erythranthe guttata]|uniref:LRAT domain-containing protein n=2 Tax=Erythranthe guttata TaxID=4155 RepID=A0A022Q9J1_ERYGU|nr:PREDICTED: uncharacterized protein LOC105972721 isoform X1 [Erythranthe guttata]EYU24269.1 hypothetical protein MIMGU_mgv1a010904mg [Erythranthe guttata]|eukprot:XP_012853154.1 PREDICTED: uncharacterized protein LOC105972721 isoform X1 [Erythranthe guttata]
MEHLSHRIEKSSLKAGDHIYSWRAAYSYSHHGIFMGGDRVVHFTRDGVLSSSLEDFLDGTKLRLYRYDSKPESVIVKLRGTCTTAVSDDEATVIYRANYLLENGFGRYNLLKKNCENFATYCKTGLLVVKDDDEEGMAGLSAQVASVKCKAVVITAFAVPVIIMGAIEGASPAAAFSAFAAAQLAVPATFAIVAGGVVFYCVRRCRADIGMRKDVKEVSVEDLNKYKEEAAMEVGNITSSRELDNRNWTMTTTKPMEICIPSTSLQLLTQISQHCVPGGYFPSRSSYFITLWGLLFVK